MPLRDDRARRVVEAVLGSLENWEARALEIAEHAHVGNKVRALSLARDLGQARVSFKRLAEQQAD